MKLVCKSMPFATGVVRRFWEEEQPRLFLWTPVVLGIGIGAYFGWPYEPNLTEAALLTLLTFLIVIRWQKSLIARVYFLIFLGFTLASIATHLYGTPLLDWPLGPATVSGVIADIEQHGKGQQGRRLLLEDLTIEKLPAHRMPRRIRLVVAERLNKHVGDVHPGQRIHALAQLMPLSEPLNPNGFDFRRNGFFQGIGATGYIMGKVQVSDPEETPGDFMLWFAKLRRNLQAKVKQTLDGDYAGLAIILLTGDKTSLSLETATAMRTVGLAHLLAIAGLHVGLVAGIVFFLSRAFFACFQTLALRYPIKKWSAFLAILAILFYTLQVGAPVPTRRAVLMAGVALLGIMFDRISFSLRTVALAALVILLIWPQMLLHPAFQLSFGAVLGLISVHDWTRRHGWRLFPGREGWYWSVARHMTELAGMSFVATVATLPSCLYHFQEAGIYSMLANTLAIPLTSFWLMPVCVFVMLLWPFGLAEWPLRLLKPGVGLLIWISQNIADLPGAHYAPPAMPIVFLIVATFGGLVFCFTLGPKRWIGLAVMITIVILTFFGTRPVIFISPNGEQVGWRREEPRALLITSYEKHEKFIGNYWAHPVNVRESELIFLEDMAEEPPLSCTESRCIWRGAKDTVAWIRNPATLAEECRNNHAVIILPVSDQVCDEGKSVLINRESLRHHGSYAIYETTKGLIIRHSRQARAQRPWSIGWRQSDRWGSFWLGP